MWSLFIGLYDEAFYNIAIDMLELKSACSLLESNLNLELKRIQLYVIIVIISIKTANKNYADTI